MATTSTERLRDLEVYTHDDGRRYVFDMRIPPGDTQDVTRVEPRPGLSVWVEFRSGTRGTVDLSDIADATPEVAELWSDRDYFETVHVADGGGGVEERPLRYQSDGPVHAGHGQTVGRSVPAGQIPGLMPRISEF